MTRTNDELAELRTQLRDLTDRAEISELCDRYCRHMDSDRDDDGWLPTVFTDDVHLVFPMGEYHGMDGLSDFQVMSRKRFERTHHISSNHTIRIDGDHATVRAHLMAVHVPRLAERSTHFGIGGHYDAEAVRTPAGWRIRRFRFDLAWNWGTPPEEAADI